MICLERVARSYQGRLALHPTSLKVQTGQRLALIGPSGCGKSTLLRLVVGLIRPDAGEVFVDNQPMLPGTARALRLRMGYVIQDGGLFPHLTAIQNVTLMARELRWEEDRIQKRLEELAELVQLPLEWLKRYPAELSGGQRQRVGCMRALMLDPPVLLLDEPMGALDPLVRSQLQEDLRHIARDLGKTVLLVTHDMAEAAYLGDEIALMKEGQVIQRGPLQSLVEQPADPFVTEFLRAQRMVN